jgi:phospholipid/cholesterol/gamma-HCH transport system substrate-binding protein
LASRTDTIEAGLTSISPGLDLLAEQRIQLTEMLGALGNFGQTAHQVVSASYTDLRTNLKELSPVLSKLAESGSALPGSLLVAATFPFPVSTIDRAIRGDFVNLFMTLDLSAETITQKVLPSIPKGAQETIFTALQAVDPLLNPSGRSPKVGQR